MHFRVTLTALRVSLALRVFYLLVFQHFLGLILFCFALFRFILFRFVLFSFVFFSFVLIYFSLFYFNLIYFILLYFTSLHFILFIYYFHYLATSLLREIEQWEKKYFIYMVILGISYINTYINIQF